MTSISPVSGHNVGHSTGGGLIDTIKNMIGGAAGGSDAAAGATAASGGGVTAAATKGDGSVGLFDGVLLKAGMGGAAGALAGWVLPFGGPLIGGIVGALGGAVMGVFGNWKKMNDIKQQNQAMLDQLGVSTQDPQIQQVLQSGNVQQLVPMAEQEMQNGGVQQGGVQQQGVAPVPTTQSVLAGPGGGVTQNPYPTQAGLHTSGVQYPTTSTDADMPPIPSAVQQDPSVMQGMGASSIMGVTQAVATLGDGTPVSTGSLGVSADGVPPAPTTAIGLGGGGVDIATLREQYDALQEQIDALEEQLAKLQGTGANAPAAA